MKNKADTREGGFSSKEKLKSTLCSSCSISSGWRGRVLSWKVIGGRVDNTSTGELQGLTIAEQKLLAALVHPRMHILYKLYPKVRCVQEGLQRAK